MLGFVDDAWFRYVENLGAIGPDKGNGGKYLMLPPDYQGRCAGWVFRDQNSAPTATSCSCAGLSRTGLHPRSRISSPTSRSIRWHRQTTRPKPSSSTSPARATTRLPPNDFSFFEGLNQVIQKEPVDAIDPEARGLLAAIGIVKGRPFNPDARMKKLLGEAATPWKRDRACHHLSAAH